MNNDSIGLFVNFVVLKKGQFVKGLLSSFGFHEEVFPFVHTSLEELIPNIETGISRVVHDEIFFHEAKSAYSGYWIERFSFAEDSPLHPVLDVVVLEEPDIVTQASARFPPVFKGGVVSIQPLLESCISEASVGLHLVGVQSGDMTGVNDILLYITSTSKRTGFIPWAGAGFVHRLYRL